MPKPWLGLYAAEPLASSGPRPLRDSRPNGVLSDSGEAFEPASFSDVADGAYDARHGTVSSKGCSGCAAGQSRPTIRLHGSR